MNKQALLISLLAIGGVLFWASQFHPGQPQTVSTEVQLQFDQFTTQFNKTYSSLEERLYRLQVFAANLNLISTHNADTESTYVLGPNDFMDLTFAEFSQYYLGESDRAEDSNRIGTTDYSQEDLLAPSNDQSDEDEVDWAQKGFVSDVKSQKMCGSCWAMGATGAVESAYAVLKKTKPTALSEQELVDCSREYGNRGCQGGLAVKAMGYIKDKALNSLSDYPYIGKNGQCNQDIAGKGWAKIKDFTVIKAGVENLVAALRKQPSSVSFLVLATFQFYRFGVYNSKHCRGPRNHAVLAVGFNLKHKTPYLRAKNSWGRIWGNFGYFKIALGSGDGTCSIAGPDRNVQPIID